LLRRHLAAFGVTVPVYRPPTQGPPRDIRMTNDDQTI
jgi:hypothetical protein